MFLYDTTLRDGAQAEGVVFSIEDKLKIIRALDELGVDYIEAGNPCANPKDEKLFDFAREHLRLKNAQLAAFGMTCRAGVPAEEDAQLRRLAAFDAGVVSLVGKACAFQVREVLRATLEDLRETFGPDRRVALCRELTKLHEETVRTTLGEAAAYYQENTPKGEYVLVVAGSPPRETAAVTLEEGTEQVLRLVAQGIRLKDAAREVSAHTGLSKNELYAAALERS